MKCSAMLVGAIALMVSAATARAGILDPNAFASLGGLSATGGQITINTDGTPTLVGPGSMRLTGVVSASGVAVFTFDGISLRDTFVVATGGRSVALLSRSNATFSGSTSLRVSAGGGAGGMPGERFFPRFPSTEYEVVQATVGLGPGGGSTLGAGGGFGGTGGGLGATPGQFLVGGRAYGDLTLGIQAGSGGMGGTESNFFDVVGRGGPGGAGGGGLEIGAIGSIGLDSGASLIADGFDGGDARLRQMVAGGGGSGGGILLNARGISLSGLISASGGDGGDAVQGTDKSPAGGGGGGRVLLVAEDLIVFSTATIDVTGGLPGDPVRNNRLAGPGQAGTVTILRTVPVPEPGSIALLGLGLVGVLGVARRRRTRPNDQGRAA